MRFLGEVLGFVTVLSAAFAVGAQPAPNMRPCDPQTTSALVQGQVEGVSMPLDTEKRIKIAVRVADYLWNLDQEHSRKYFADAMALARGRAKEKGTDEKRDGFLGPSRVDYRLWVLQFIARHDSVWARKLGNEIAKEIEDESKQNADGAGAAQFKLQQLLESASIIFKRDPRAALEMARTAYRLPFRGATWSWFLFNIAETRKAVADNFYSELLNRFTNEPLTELAFLYSYPFGKVRGLGLERLSVYNRVPSGFSPNLGLQKLFLSAFVPRVGQIASSSQAADSAARKNQALYGFAALQELEVETATAHPEFASRIQVVKVQLSAMISQKERDDLAGRVEREQLAASPFDERLRQLESIRNPDDLDLAIVQLVFNSQDEDELAALESWIGKIADRNVEASAAQFYYNRRAEVAINDGRLEDAQRFAEKVDELEFRAVLYLRMAEKKLGGETETVAANEILGDLEKMALRADDSVGKFRALLGVAFLFDRFNNFRSLDALSNAVKTANKLEDQDLLVSSVVRKIEKDKKFGFYAAYGMPGFDLETAFARAGRSNFNGALNEARALSDKYWQTLALIAVVKACVEDD